MIDAHLTYKVRGGQVPDPDPDPEPEPVDLFELTASEQLASQIYYAKGSLKSNLTPAVTGDSIQRVLDLKSDKHLDYAGIPQPTLTGRPPIYDDRGLGAISFDNEPLTSYEVNLERTDYPLEVSLILVNQPGTAFEAWMNNYGSYMGDAGGAIRLVHSNATVSGSQAPPKFFTGHIHAKFDNGRADLWVDSVYQGFVTFDENPEAKWGNKLGVNTNNAQWEFIAHHCFERELTTQERNQFFADMALKFKVGQEKQMPYARNGWMTRVGDNFTATYEFRNPLGFPEDTTKTKYRWVGLGDGWLSDQWVLDGAGKTINLSQIRADVIQLKVEVQVYDTQGNTWKRIPGDWMHNIRVPGEEPEEPGEPGGAPQEGERRISLSPEDISAVSFLTRWDDGEKYVHHRNVGKLADHSYISEVDGHPVGTPTNTPVVEQYNYGQYSGSWYNVDRYTFVIDLKQSYDVTRIYRMMGGHSSSGFWIWGSNDGYTREKLIYDNTPFDFPAGWQNMPLDLPEAQDIRYLIFATEHAEYRINGILVYGIPKIEQVIPGVKSTRDVPERTFSETFGTNAFLQEQNFDMIANTSTVVRYYNDNNWLVSSYAGTTLQPEQVILTPKTSHMWDFDAKLQEAKTHGHKVLFCFKNTPEHLGTTGPGRGAETKPTDPGVNNRSLAETSDPMSYKHMARIAFLFAARYGKNSDIDPVYDSQYSDANPPYGLDLFEYFEVGNEPDGAWKGEDQVTMPIELAAMYSAIYDGHKGAMGPGFGLKAADANMKFANGGLVEIKASWFKEMCRWWDANRGPGDYPIDVLNVHHYNAWERDFNAIMWSDMPAYGTPPEKGLYLPEMKELSNFRDKVIPGAEVWVTETGYDEHYGGMHSPNDRNQIPRSRHKAAWIMRTFLTINRYSDAITQYWYGDDWNRVGDFNPDNIQRELFMTCGYVEGINAANDRNRRPMTTYWYIVSFKSDMEGYFFSHPVVENGVSLTTEALAFDLHPELWVYAFKKQDGSSCLVAWMGADDWKTHSSKIPVTETSVEVIDYVEHELRQQLTGNATTVTSIVNGSSRYINATLTEYPMIIKTANIGTPKLQAPSNAILHGNVLTWDDYNTETVTTEIYSSNSQSTGYTLEHSATFSELKYTLPASPKQYYQIRFVLGNRFSDPVLIKI